MNGFALCLGLNRVDTSAPAYAGAEIPLLSGCVNDARALAALLASRGFPAPTLLLDLDATRSAVLDALSTAAGRLSAGDLFALTYSGHGMLDGPRNAWVLADGPLYSGELWRARPAFAADVGVVVLSDSCHSGRAVRALDRYGVRDRELPPPTAAVVARNARLRADPPAAVPGCAVLLISGCQEDETSLDADDHGVFTGAFLETLPAVTGDYHDLYEVVRDATVRKAATFGHVQTPNFFKVGDPPGVAVLAGSYPVLAVV